MSAGRSTTASDTITQLEAARHLALSDAAYYPQIVPGVLPIIGPTASLELRRWGADFLAETFAIPILSNEQKERLVPVVLQMLKDYLETPTEDASVIKSTVQAVTSIYPLAFRYTIYNPHDAETWQKMVAIKSNILKRMDSSPAGVKVCCIKFVQRIVQVQTAGIIADPRRPEQNELSLALVSRGHPSLSPPMLEAEAHGLLDRLLSVFEETPRVALYITATLNGVGVLVRTRASLAGRIVNAVLNFNPFASARAPLSPRDMVVIKSMERTTRAFLLNLHKRNPTHPLGARIQSYLDRLQQFRSEAFDDQRAQRLKRAAPVEPTDGLDASKRQRLGAEVSSTPTPQPVSLAQSTGPISIAELYTLTTDDFLKSFHVEQIPIDIVNRIIVPILSSIDQDKLHDAVNIVRTRYLQISQPPPPSALDAIKVGSQTSQLSQSVATPQHIGEDAEQVINELDSGGANAPVDLAVELTRRRFIVPQPRPLSAPVVVDYGRSTISRIFSHVSELGEPSISRGGPSGRGFARLATGPQDRDASVTLITRLATRAQLPTPPSSPPDQIKTESNTDTMTIKGSAFTMSTIIRNQLYAYVLEDFRRRIDIAISWLTEEWYADRVRTSSARGFGNRAARTAALATSAPGNYEIWILNVLDGIVPYVDAKDKLLIRFLSEIPAINADILERIKKLAQDPERVGLAVNSILYLVFYRLPARDICLDALEDLYRNYDDARPVVAKHIGRWRPHVLDDQSPQQQQPIQQQPLLPLDIKPSMAANTVMK